MVGPWVRPHRGGPAGVKSLGNTPWSYDLRMDDQPRTCSWPELEAPNNLTV